MKLDFKMRKGIFALLFISLLLFSMVGVSAICGATDKGQTPAQTPPLNDQVLTSPSVSTTPLADYFAKDYPWLSEKIALWETGGSISDVTLKYFFLILVIMLIYAALAYVNFPDTFGGGGGFVRFIIATVVGIIATFAISSAELLTILQSYTALGLTLTIFFPIMIVVFFNLVVASAGNPIGIFTTRIIWLIYSGFLFFKSISIVLIKWGSINIDVASLRCKIANFFVGEQVMRDVVANKYDNTISLILLLVSIAIFVIFVVKGRGVDEWIAKEKRNAEIEVKKAELERSRAYDTLRSEEMKRAGSKV